jgi:hypothetical protein
MAELCQHYRINEENLNLRKQFIRLTADDIEILRQLAPWAEERASQIAKEFYDHQFSFSETRAFFEKFAQQRGLSLEQLRNRLEKTQADYFRADFPRSRRRRTLRRRLLRTPPQYRAGTRCD